MQHPTSGKPFSFDFKLLRTVCIALLSAEVPLLVATLPLGLHAPAAIAQTQSAEAVAKIAKGVTVRIEGATQGSGVLVKRVGNRYTLLTAWHVVSGQRPGEELDIYTADGQRHQFEQGSIKRLGEVDMAVLTFSSPGSYQTAGLSDGRSVNTGSSIYVSGFPLPTSAIPTRVLRFLKGDVIANATVAIPNGYQLLYSNQTLPGMSGGAVLNSKGQLVGIHGQGETDSKMSEQQGITVKTGTNQAIPITYYSQYSSGSPIIASSTQATTADDYLAQAKALLGKKGREEELIKLTNEALKLSQSMAAHIYQGITLLYTKEYLGAIMSFDRAVEANAEAPSPRKWRGIAYLFKGDLRRACPDFKKAKQLGDQDMAATYTRYCTHETPRDLRENGQLDQRRGGVEQSKTQLLKGIEKFEMGDTKGAISSYTMAISLDPKNAVAYYKRCYAKWTFRDYKGVIADCNHSINIDPRMLALTKLAGALSDAYAEVGDRKNACKVLRSARLTNSMYYASYCK